MKSYYYIVAGYIIIENRHFWWIIAIFDSLTIIFATRCYICICIRTSTFFLMFPFRGYFKNSLFNLDCQANTYELVVHSMPWQCKRPYLVFLLPSPVIFIFSISLFWTSKSPQKKQKENFPICKKKNGLEKSFFLRNNKNL